MEFQIADWLRVIAGLAGLAPIPHAELAGKLAGIVADLIAAEKARSNQTTEEILTAAGLTQESTRLLIEAELARIDTKPLE